MDRLRRLLAKVALALVVPPGESYGYATRSPVNIMSA